MVIIGLCSLAIVIAGLIAAWAIRINKGESALDAAKLAAARAEQTAKEIADLKVHVAETYVSHSAMAEVERRLTDTINSVVLRLERLFHPTPPHA